jgi:hypothetical protein
MINKITAQYPGKADLDDISKIILQDVLNDSAKDMTTEFSLVMRLMNGASMLPSPDRQSSNSSVRLVCYL